MNIYNETNGNQTNGTLEVYVPYTSRPETYIVPVVFALIFIVGALGNGILVLVFLKHKNMRSVPNTYIFSLALGDLLVIVTSVPFTSTIYTVESWPFGELICKVSESAKDISIGVSVFTLTALSADRFFAIVDPMRKLHTAGGGKRATRCTILVVAIIWVLAVVLALPATIFSFLKRFDIDSHQYFYVCYPFPDDIKWYPRLVVLLKFIIYYAVPLLIIGVFYVLMARHLFLSTRNLPGESGRQVRARKKVAKMVLAFVFIFAICFLPQHVFMLWFHFTPTVNDDYNSFWHSLRIIGFCLSYTNSCINPIALFCVSGAFRKHYYTYLFCCFRGQLKRSQSLSMTSTRRLGTLRTSLRKGDKNWESISMCGNYHLQHTNKTRQSLIPEVTVTTFVNGGNGLEVYKT